MRVILIGFVVIAVIMIAIPVLLSWSASRRRLRVAPAGGAVVLRMPRGHHAILASIVILPSAAFAFVAFTAAWPRGGESNGLILGGFMSLLGGLGGGYLLAREVRARLRLDEEGLERFGVLGRLRASWSEVARITFNPVNNWFFLTLASGRRVYVEEGMDGICDFGELALRKLPPAVLQESPEAAEALRELAGM